MTFIIENLIQKTPEWKKWRSEGITATDITVIMGLNPYKTVADLYTEKVHKVEQQASNPAMLHGVEQEPIAKAWIESHKGINLESPCIIDDEYPIARCSLDGLDRKNRTLYEIKSPYSSNRVFDAFVFDQVPAYWLAQVQWQLMITGFEMGYIAIWDSKQQTCHFIRVEANKAQQEEMCIKAKEFWKQVETLSPPEGVLVSNNSSDLKAKFDRYFEIQGLIKDLEATQEELKKELLASETEYKCFSYKVKKKKGPTTYAYKQMIEAGIDLTPFAKPSSYYFSISKEKDCNDI